MATFRAIGGQECSETELTMLMTNTGKSYDQIEFSILLSMLDNLYEHV